MAQKHGAPGRAFGEHMLSCSICLEPFRAPRVLPCLHSFCQDCLERHHHIYKLSNGGKLSCPTCRAVIPLPLNGVSGFRSDISVDRIRHLLSLMPADIQWEQNATFGDDEMELEGDSGDETSDDEMPSRRRDFIKPGERHALLDEAAGGEEDSYQGAPDNPEFVVMCASLHKHQSTLQSAIANIRSKMLQLYHIENFIRVTMQKEIDGKMEKLAKEEKAAKPSKKSQKKITAEVEEKHGPNLALLLKEQDKLFQKIVEAKSVHDLVEEILERTSVSQVSQIFEFSMKLQKQIFPLIKMEVGSAGKDSVLRDIPLPADLVSSVRSGLVQPCQMTMMPSVKDPRKMGVQLLFRITGLGKQAGKFDFPTHATFHPNGDLIVSDKNNHRIQVFDKKGHFKQELFTGSIKPRRAKINPVNHNLYVSDEMSETVKVYSPEGVLLSRVGEGYFVCPAGLDFDSKGNLIMTDPEKNYVSIHDCTTGKLLHKFFFRYIDDKKVPNPYYLAVNEDDQFIIADKRNGRIKVFASNGQLLFRINKLDCPRGVCVDPYGNILVTEGDKHRIAMYSAYGKFVQFLIDQEEHGLCYPLSLAMDNHGRLAVTQCGYMSPHEVLVFQIC